MNIAVNQYENDRYPERKKQNKTQEMHRNRSFMEEETQMGHDTIEESVILPYASKED